MDPVWHVDSVMPGVVWPALPGADAATLLSVCFHLEQSQWLAADAMRARQFEQLATVVRHAHASVPYYRDSWVRHAAATPLTWEAFLALPLLRRRDLQAEFERLKSTAYPAQHGVVEESRTSGSTGAPVRALKTGLGEIYWRAFALRDHAWHRRDLGGKLAAIRQGASAARGDNWGPATYGVVRTGPAVTLPVGTDVSVQLDWLEREQPAYLLSHPSNIGALARLSLSRGVRLPGLREVRTSGEILPDDVRALCREAWNVPVADMYSSNEVGYIALQCPVSGHYHVMAEGLLVEVLADDGSPCPPGAVGRVVVTTLHNFAMPLIRYEIGDYAEVAPRCACGRGLPALRRILGRVRNMLVTADGRRYWPSFSVRALSELVPVRQHQFVQKEIDLFEARLVVASPLTREQEEKLVAHLRARLPDGVRIEVVYCDAIPRGTGGKFEDFISYVT